MYVALGYLTQLFHFNSYYCLGDMVCTVPVRSREARLIRASVSMSDREWNVAGELVEIFTVRSKCTVVDFC